ncbi:MAG: DUF1573 domain-containing protein [Planctomycetaceae bacterium]|nr:DUF1573 domain-containing protein [Planctomycetaceae bacterium]
MIKIKDYDFGNVSRNAKAEYEFEVYNPYLEDIHIRSVSASCSCTTVSVDKSTIKTYETAKVKAHFNTDRFVGNRSATLTAVIDKPFYATVQLHVKGNIRSDISFQPGEVNFGSVSRGQAVEKQVEFTYQGRSNWQVTELKSTNQDVSAELTEISRNYGQVRYRLKVKLASDASVGYINDRIILVANESYNREIPIMVQGIVKQGVTVNPSKLIVGNLEPGQVVTKKIVLRADSPFAIKKVTCPNDQYSFDFQKTNPSMQSTNIHIVSVSYKAPESIADEQFTDRISIFTDAQQTPVELQTYAKVLADIHQNNEPQSEIAAPSDKSQDAIADDLGILSRFDP